MFFVFEWQMVTVALACLSNSSIGVPTILLRPMTTAEAPSMVVPEVTTIPCLSNAHLLTGRSNQFHASIRCARDKTSIEIAMSEKSRIEVRQSIEERAGHVALGVSLSRYPSISLSGEMVFVIRLASIDSTVSNGN